MSASYVLGQKSVNSSSNDCFDGTNSSFCNTLPAIYYDPTSQLLFVGDWASYRVMIFNLSTGISNDMPAIYELGQTDFTGTDCPTISASSLCSASGFAYDPVSQELYVADEGYHRVLGFSFSSGITNGMSATSILGQSDYSSSYPNGVVQPNNYGFYYPNAVALDPTNHRLFVADEYNSRIMVFDLDSNNNIISKTASYVLGQLNFNSSHCAPNQYQICWPINLAYDSVDNYLIVGGYYDEIAIYNLSAGITNGMNIAYKLGLPVYNYSPCTATQSVLCSEPDGMYFDNNSDHLFVTDASDNRVMVYDFSSGVSNYMNASYVIGQSNFSLTTCGSGASSLCAPKGVTYDPTNQRLFVDDFTNERIQVYNLAGGISDGMAASYSITGTSNFYGLNYDIQSGTLLAGNFLNSTTDIIYVPPSQSTNISEPSALTGTMDSAFYVNYFYDDYSDQMFGAQTGYNRVMVYNFAIQSPVAPPTNSIALPAQVSGFTNSVAPVNASVTDNSSSTIAQVQLLVDGSLNNTLSVPPFDFNVNTTSLPDGNHTLAIKSKDSKGNTKTTQQTILVNNGDLNNDGTVNLSDLAVMAINWGATSATYSQGSIMGNGQVNISDLAILANNWGWVAP